MHTVGSVCSSDVRISERVRKETNGVVLSRDRASEKPDPPGVNNGWDLIRHFGRGSPHLWRLVIRVSRAVVHGRIKTVKTEYSEDELPLDRDFAAVLLDWRARGPKSELVFPSHITGRHFHASPIQQDYIRPAGCCLVVCPKCSAQIGAWCQDRAGKHVEVHEGRWASAGSIFPCRMAYVPPHVSFVVGFDGSTARSSAETHAARPDLNHHERVRKCIDGLQARRQ